MNTREASPDGAEEDSDDNDPIIGAQQSRSQTSIPSGNIR